MLQQILEDLRPNSVKLVAVSKTKPNSAILDLYGQGQRIFGENYVQELKQKHEELPKDIEWHMIGHLQSNKVKYIAPFIHTIHSVDSASLLKEINKRAKQHDRIINCLLQFHIAEESSKTGFSLEKVEEILEQGLENVQNINIQGVMGMATFTSDKVQVKTEFQRLKTIFNQVKSKYFAEKEDFKDISMGMSGDYKLAIEEGSTMVRIGSLLFGARR